MCSERFFGLWPKGPVTDAQLPAFVAILNGPVASAFLAAHAPLKGSCLAALKNVPVPPAAPPRAAELAADYARRLREPETAGSEERLEELLTRIDAAVSGRTTCRPVSNSGFSTVSGVRRARPLMRGVAGTSGFRPRPHPGGAAVGALPSARELDSRRLPAVAGGGGGASAIVRSITKPTGGAL